jgi:mono/diheme cytochrome c family protein
MSMKTWLVPLLLMVALPAVAQPGQRWYQPAHAALGKQLYQQHCASCHEPDASGDPAWRTRNAKGLLPPPPLNGTAHSWHHPLAVLYRQIMRGSAPGVGDMPAFRDKLSRGQALAIIAYFQSLWPDEIYQAWQRTDQAASQGEMQR